MGRVSILPRDTFYFEILENVEKGLTRKKFQAKIAKRYGLSEGAVYQRYLKLLEKLDEDIEQSKTARKGLLRKLKNLVTFPENGEVEQKKEGVLDTLIRVHSNRLASTKKKSQEDQ